MSAADAGARCVLRPPVEVIDPRETRTTVIPAPEMAATKHAQRAWKKHGVVPV